MKRIGKVSWLNAVISRRTEPYYTWTTIHLPREWISCILGTIVLLKPEESLLLHLLILIRVINIALNSLEIEVVAVTP